MNSTGKTISSILYVIALALAAIAGEKYFAPVAISGMALFFVVHTGLRIRQAHQRKGVAVRTTSRA